MHRVTLLKLLILTGLTLSVYGAHRAEASAFDTSFYDDPFDFWDLEFGDPYTDPWADPGGDIWTDPWADPYVDNPIDLLGDTGDQGGGGDDGGTSTTTGTSTTGELCGCETNADCNDPSFPTCDTGNGGCYASAQSGTRHWSPDRWSYFGGVSSSNPPYVMWVDSGSLKCGGQWVGIGDASQGNAPGSTNGGVKFSSWHEPGDGLGGHMDVIGLGEFQVDTESNACCGTAQAGTGGRCWDPGMSPCR